MEDDHCATNWKVAGSISVDVIGVFYWINPSGRTVALGSTQPNMSW
jgi:elongation factor P hydroxylase